MTATIPGVTVDLRSDTVTVPDERMRRAMAEAVVGDDVYGEDPTVNELQAEAARMLGHEAGLFMPSGTMTNQVAIAVHTQRGQEVIVPEGAHVYEWELGMMATFSGVVPRFVHAPRGVPAPEDVRAAIRRSVHQSPTGLISLENTHNKAGGTIVPTEVSRAVREIADEEGLPLHLDGARVMNAAVALGVPVRELTGHYHSVSLCLSKGLGAPVGSVLVGSRELIGRAHRYRKMMGGGMRQAGVLAAAGLLALREG
ncbi:threonine aldolase family protein, partial [Deinococcus pimensis]|uniref:threonine aldolase family protein n=1 Tax=Deinococcus pimensis TaxID=309888 RepID=UPI0005EB9BDC